MATKNIYSELWEMLRQNQPCIMATVVKSRGSTPQVPGSSVLIGTSGLLSGTIGGGPAEYQVLCKAQEALESRISEVISFDLNGDLTKGSDAICGGNMVILMDAAPEKHLATFENLRESLNQHQPGVLLTFIEERPDKNLIISRFWLEENKYPELPEPISKLAGPSIVEMINNLTSGEFRLVSDPGGLTGPHDFACLQTMVPPPSLVIAGAGHVGKAVAHLGKFLGFEVTVWDDRSEYANKTNLPDTDIILNGSVDETIAKHVVKKDSYLVIVTRGHKNDAEVLRKWIKTGAAYIGMMGSRVKVAQMQQQFMEQGWATREEWDRVHTPIGLKIGAKTVEEIAVSIAAELVQIRNLTENKTLNKQTI